ncbi:hypothetical protein [Streptosporangium amethystogenes]|uniref:hypothetical protein n=1 Tax=Streptosporangium amethystogenes TaxID=2002 RepID=UPI0012F95007|nr:hypothetical protein [Streptosporangium amethystogenes]
MYHHLPEWISLIVSAINLAAAIIRLITARLQRRGAFPASKATGTSRPEPESSTNPESR